MLAIDYLAEPNTYSSVLHLFDPWASLVFAGLGVLVILRALYLELRHARVVGWKTYGRSWSHLLRVVGALATTAVSIPMVSRFIEVGLFDLMPGNPISFGILFCAGVFAMLLRGMAHPGSIQVVDPNALMSASGSSSAGRGLRAPDRDPSNGEPE